MNLKTALIFCSVAFLLFQCNRSISCAGGGSTTTDNAQVSGRVLSSDGAPATGAAVHVRPAQYVRQIIGPEPDSITRHDTTVNDSGWFYVDSLRIGEYRIEVNDNASSAVLLTCDIVTQKDSIVLPPDTLAPYQAISGKVDSVLIGKPDLYVQVFGLDRIAPVDSITGAYAIIDLPPGTYSLRVVSSDTLFTPEIIDTVITIVNQTPPIVYGDSVSDIDGNVYHSVVIGTQTWTIENLRTTRLNDGTTITFAGDSAEWANFGTPKYCYSNNTTDADTIKKYGALYNGYALQTNLLAPAGWHVADSVEWYTLERYLIQNGYNWDGSADSNRIAKSLAAKTDWPVIASPRPGAVSNTMTTNNTTGFSAYPSGNRSSSQSLYNFGTACSWWVASVTFQTYPSTRYLDCDWDGLGINYFDNNMGFSVRLIKD
jgi:uncharacterized protein (TIGR02145 family)